MPLSMGAREQTIGLSHKGLFSKGDLLAFKKDGNLRDGCWVRRPHASTFLPCPCRCKQQCRSLMLSVFRYRKLDSGVKLEGKRRALIPPEVGYVDETLKPIPEEVQNLQIYDYSFSIQLQFGPRRSLLSHAKEPLVFEVQLLKVL
ncbi:hypothetical protein PR202_ga06816 [Eleusine coracana subsp. coracana]|uniref:Peptidylprolyl isomerase n=1 Tax=Eleusine coracana subsp. coracana TaxID=191504 RepID=A0AAV5BXQ5_ELECO|nr:hypothetical protein PR202_ga06816 [Eleusine coracana subsp. coracana]